VYVEAVLPVQPEIGIIGKTVTQRSKYCNPLN